VFRAQIPPDPVSARPVQADSTAFAAMPWFAILRLTLSSHGPWLVALTFGSYSLQWLAVIGFLPSMYAQAGLDVRSAGALTALVSLVNIGGNVASGWLLQRGVSARKLLLTGFAFMALGAWVSFGWSDTLPPLARYFAILLFSCVGGLIPGTLFNLAVQVAPTPQAVPASVGWMLQWSFIGQFAGPPLVAWVAQMQGGWGYTWWVTVGACGVGCVLASLVRQPSKN
jgi:cyanate permease